MPDSDRDAEAARNVQMDDGVGLGIDIVEIARMERILKRTPRFRVRVFTEGERAYCDAASQPAVHYATRFAAKEAVLKALGTGFSAGIGPQDVEVVRNSKGRPLAKLHRKAASAAKELGVVDLPISLSFTHEEAVACAMAITADSVNAQRKRTDPMQELTRQFREARSLLDDLPAAGGNTGGGSAAGDARGGEGPEASFGQGAAESRGHGLDAFSGQGPAALSGQDVRD